MKFRKLQALHTALASLNSSIASYIADCRSLQVTVKEIIYAVSNSLGTLSTIKVRYSCVKDVIGKVNFEGDQIGLLDNVDFSVGQEVN